MSVASRLKLLAKLKRKKYRDAYVEEHVRTSLPFQIRALREQREWTQGQLAGELKTTQTAVSRLENPEYGKLSLNSLYKLASAFDVALLVKFVPFSRLIEEFQDASPQALSAMSFEEEVKKLEDWAGEEASAVQTSPDLPVQATQTPARHLRLADTATVTGAIQRTFTFDLPRQAPAGEATANRTAPLRSPQTSDASIRKVS
jgi:transcriptional regulator with XRE-family HTH domain